MTTHAAADHCVRQLDSALSQARAAGQLAPVVVAYELLHPART